MTIKIKLWADYGCWPIWNIDELDNIDPVDLPLNSETIKRLNCWQDTYNQTLNQDYPPLSAFPNEEAEKAFKQEGWELWQQLRRELTPDYEVFYQTDGKLLADSREVKELILT